MIRVIIWRRKIRILIVDDIAGARENIVSYYSGSDVDVVGAAH
jgi:hypothetical protein